MARYRGWVGEGEVGGEGGWKAGGGLNPLLGVFGLAMSPKSTSHTVGPSMLEWHKGRLPVTGVIFRPTPSM